MRRKVRYRFRHLSVPRLKQRSYLEGEKGE